ncbi:MAG: 1,3-beta-glucanosyltransferase gas1 [Alyxoria varia]|nr:MAG: 1,3-beta-glucanosyltransferase gas1 [Alyxoria varia]
MRLSTYIRIFAAAAATLSATAGAQSWRDISPLQIKGQHFFYRNNGSEFFIKGIAYQRGVESSADEGVEAGGEDPPDPLADPAACRRDVPYMKRLQTNAIRVYAVDPEENHDECMTTLADAGIYVIIDLGLPSVSINRNTPAWNGPLYQRYISVIDAFAKYNHVMGYFAGNEVSNSPNTTAASAFVKAAVRDSKAYIQDQGYTDVGVGYATYDGPIRDNLAQYFVCQDPAERISFWGYNVYSWCGDSDYQRSGYRERVDFFEDYPVPVFFAEYGCNEGGTREFTDVPVLYGPRMTPTFSGGIVYMWFQEENDYGLVNVDGDEVNPRPDFTSLSSQMAKVDPSSTNIDGYTPPSPATSWSDCPSVVTTGPSSAIWLAEASPLPPTPNQELCQCLMDTLDCVSTSNNANSYGRDFNFICGEDPGACAGIAANATTGRYGAYGQCSPQEQLSFVMNRYYQGQSGGAQASACQFNGRASTTSGGSPSGSCSSLINAAGTNGGGNVPQPSGDSSAQASQGGRSTSTSSQGAASGLVVPTFEKGVVFMTLYVVSAAVAGAGMILL